MIVQLDQLYVDAMKRRYIVGAFNVFNYDSLCAVSSTHLRYNPSLKLAIDISREVEAPIEVLFIFEEK